MSDDQEPKDKPHAPTPRRQEEAKRKGQVPKSNEVNAAVILLTGTLVVTAGAATLGRGILEIYGEAFARSTAFPADAPAASAWITALGWKVLSTMTPVIMLLFVMALIVAGGQGRGVFSAEPLKPTWEKIDPIKNAKKIWGWKALVEFGKSLLKLLIIGAAIALVFYLVRDRIPLLVQLSPFALLDLIRASAFRMLLFAGIAYIVVAAIDYSYQVWEHDRNLRMSDQELRRELKDSEGDPQMRARRTSMGRSLARRRMMLSVSEADVVLTNPTHVSVALKWDPSVAPAPIVLALGKRKTALRIREMAREHGIPIVENPPLARALFKAGRVGQPIPVEFYVLVAEVLAFVFRERAKRNDPWAGSAVA
jgi:flagellar biosynthetic protein FlhB